MRTEPDLNKSSLLECLRDCYLLEVARLTVVPYGLDSWSYVATCHDGSRAFVKLPRRAPSTDATASELPLQAALAAGLAPVPRPMADRHGGYLNAFRHASVHGQAGEHGERTKRASAPADEPAISPRGSGGRRLSS